MVVTIVYEIYDFVFDQMLYPNGSLLEARFESDLQHLVPRL